MLEKLNAKYLRIAEKVFLRNSWPKMFLSYHVKDPCDTKVHGKNVDSYFLHELIMRFFLHALYNPKYQHPQFLWLKQLLILSESFYQTFLFTKYMFSNFLYLWSCPNPWRCCRFRIKIIKSVTSWIPSINCI